MESGSITVEEKSDVGILTIDRALKRNALNDTLIEEFVQKMDEVAKTPARAIVITGAGDASFCAGYDIDCIDPSNQGLLPLPDVRFERVIEAVGQAACPVIASINGNAFGGGLDLALACDFRLAREGAAFAMTPCKIGLIYSPGGVSRFLCKLGPSVTRRLLLTATPVDAQEALNCGIIDSIVPAGEIMNSALDLANKIAANAPLAVNGTRKVIQAVEQYRTADLDPKIARELESLRNEAFNSADLKEALCAFKEKGKPAFRGE